MSGRLTLAGTELMLDASGAVFVPEARLLVVSDMHLEKGSSYGAKGIFLPPYDTRATLKKLEQAIRKFAPERILSLGDTFHDRHAERRMMAEDFDRLLGLCRDCEWIFVLGNHDPLPPERFPGRAAETVTLAGLTFAHEPEGEGWHLAGHLHPCAVVERDGKRVRRPCFVSDGTRLILPSFGAFTGGLNVLDRAFAHALERPREVHLLGQGRTYRVPAHALRHDARGLDRQVLRRGSSARGR